MTTREPVIHCDPEILSGTPVFVGTRVPVQALFDYLEGRHSLDEFLDDFPTVSREKAIAVLEHARERCACCLTSAFPVSFAGTWSATTCARSPIWGGAERLSKTRLNSDTWADE
jgi:uncharacterized protein (DUF433 family)